MERRAGRGIAGERLEIGRLGRGRRRALARRQRHDVVVAGAARRRLHARVERGRLVAGAAAEHAAEPHENDDGDDQEDDRIDVEEPAHAGMSAHSFRRAGPAAPS